MRAAGQTKWVRVAPQQWVAVNAEGLDVKTGQKPVPWVEQPPPMKTLKPKLSWRQKKNRALHPKFHTARIITTVTAKDPKSPLWCEREPYLAYQWAEAAFVLESLSIAEIVRRTGFKPRRVEWWAYANSSKRVSWRHQRQQYQARLMKELEKTVKDQCQALISQTLSLVDKKLSTMNASDGQAEKLTVGEVQKLVDVIGELHKISQLESGDPTQIQANLRLTHAQVVDKLKAADPLIDYDAANNPPPAAVKH